MTHIVEPAGWLALAYASGFNLSRTKSIVHRWCLDSRQPLSALFDMPADRLAAQLDLTPSECAAVQGLREQLPRYVRWCQELEAGGVSIITRAEATYPPALIRALLPAEQPLLLYARGQLPPPQVALAAIVGDHYADRLEAEIPRAGCGDDVAQDLAGLLVDEGVALVSGLGRGVGCVEVAGVLAAGCGRAVRVAPMGISAVEAASAFEPALAQGRAALVSPFRPDAPFSDTNAQACNRLIAAFADVVMVMQACLDGAAHRLAVEALRLGRGVYVWEADPDDDEAMRGYQSLLEAGAAPVGEMADLLDMVAGLKAIADGRCAEMGYAASAGEPATPVVEAATGCGAAVGADQVLAVLARGGHVPEALRRRLLGT